LKPKDTIEDDNVTWMKADPFRPKYYFFNRTPFQSLSDSEQTDLIVTDFQANYEEDMEMPHILLQYRIREDITAPNDPDLYDSPHDKPIMASPATGWFTLVVRQRDPKDPEKFRTLYIPYNLQKEWFPAVDVVKYNRPGRSNQNVTIPEWVFIDQQEGAVLVTPATDPNCPFQKALRVKIRYTYSEIAPRKKWSIFEKATNTPKEYYRYLWYPKHLEAPDRYPVPAGETIPRVLMDINYGKIGPAHFVKYTIARQNPAGQIVDRSGAVINLDSKAYETLILYPPIPERELEKVRSDIREASPWVDDDGIVHLPSRIEIEGKNELDLCDYNQLKTRLVRETLYERFLPVANALPYFEPSEIE
jgi:hypothetical protein